MESYRVAHPAKSRSPLIVFLKVLYLSLFPALALTQGLLPCSLGTQTWTVASTNDTATLASMLECSNGSFAVEWFGDVVVSQTIHVTEGTSLVITGASSGATADGNHNIRLFVADGGSSLHITDMVIANGDEEVGGAILALEQANISFGGNMTFASNTASFGGAIYAESSTTVHWEGEETVFRNNYAEYYGGAIMMQGSSVLWWDGATHFLNNTAPYRGGAVFVNESSRMSWSGNTTFAENTSGLGGAIYANSSTIVIWGGGNATFRNNYAEYYGGAIMAEDSSSISWDGDAVYMNNTVTYWGAALCVFYSSHVSWTGHTNFLDNSARDGAGVLIYENSTASWSGTTTFARNTVSYTGGGLNVHTGSKASWTGETIFTGNMANGGGAMYVWDSDVSWTGDTTFADNAADLDGGAIYATISAHVIVQGTTTFVNNSATTGVGGALSIYGSTSSGGSYVNISGNTTFTNNFASAIGGAICISASAGGQYLEGVTFKSNSAGIGGAVATFGNGNANEGATEPTICLRCQFADNMASSSGLAVAAFGSVEMNGSFFNGNVLSCDEGFIVEERSQEHSSTERYQMVCAGCPGWEDCIGCTMGDNASEPICSIAPEHTFADEPGTRVETLRIEKGYWRATTESTTILACYNEAACQGGQTGTESFCADGYMGAYCSVCESGYSPSLSSTCTQCSASRRRWFVAIAVVTGSVTIFAMAVISVYFVSKNFGDQRTTSIAHRMLRGVPVQAFKSVVVVWQILTQFASVANITYPGVYQAFLSSVNIINLDIGFVVSAGCIWSGIDFHDRLIASTLSPLAFLGLLAMTYAIAMRWSSTSDDSVRETIRNKHLSAVLLLLFFVYSSVSSTVFRTFACDPLDGGKEYLRADYRILCTDEKHKALQVYAGFMIAVYPVGIPLLFAVLLYHRRDVLSDSAADKAGAQSIASLWAPYRPGRFYYEIVESARRITLTGVVVFIYPNDTAQIAITIINSLFFFVVFEVLSPYQSVADTWLTRFGHILIFFSMFDILLLKVDASRESSESQQILAGVLVAGHVVMMVAVVAEAITICYASRLSAKIVAEGYPSLSALRRPSMHMKRDEAEKEEERHADSVLGP